MEPKECESTSWCPPAAGFGADEWIFLAPADAEDDAFCAQAEATRRSAVAAEEAIA